MSIPRAIRRVAEPMNAVALVPDDSSGTSPSALSTSSVARPKGRSSDGSRSIALGSWATDGNMRPGIRVRGHMIAQDPVHPPCLVLRQQCLELLLHAVVEAERELPVLLGPQPHQIAGDQLRDIGDRGLRDELVPQELEQGQTDTADGGAEYGEPFRLGRGRTDKGPGQPVPRHTVPGHIAPGHTVPGHTVRGHIAPGHTVPGDSGFFLPAAPSRERPPAPCSSRPDAGISTASQPSGSPRICARAQRPSEYGLNVRTGTGSHEVSPPVTSSSRSERA